MRRCLAHGHPEKPGQSGLFFAGQRVPVGPVSAVNPKNRLFSGSPQKRHVPGARPWPESGQGGGKKNFERLTPKHQVRRLWICNLHFQEIPS